MKIPVYEPTLGEDEKQYVLECLEENWISSRGRFIDRFESQFADYVGIENAIAVTNGTVALHVAFAALGIGHGDEVICPTLTYIASANAIRYTGAEPVFVDCDRSSWQIDPEEIRRHIGPKTRAILVVHLYGQPAEMTSIRKVADEFNLKIVEDCAEAIGAKVGDHHVGTFGDVATFSFYGNKTISTGEGGMVVTPDSGLSDRIRHLKGQGLAKDRQYWHDVVGFNYRMTNIAAAIGCGQLNRIDATLQRKREIAIDYRERLSGIFEFQGESPTTTHGYWMNCFLVSHEHQRESAREFLAERGVETRPVFYPIHTMPMYMAEDRTDRGVISLCEKDEFSNSKYIAACGINLPSHPSLTDEQVSYVCAALKEFIAVSKTGLIAA